MSLKRKEKNHYTINKNCDNLFPSGSCSIGSLHLNGDTLPEVVKVVWQHLRDWVFPFIVEYSQTETLIQNLSGDAEQRVTSDPIARYAILMSDAAIRGKQSDFEDLARGLLAYCTGHAIAHRPLADSITLGLRGDYFS